MIGVVVAVLILILLAILISYVPRISETMRVVLFVALVVLTLLYLLRGSIL
jgi:hypothetical protein